MESETSRLLLVAIVFMVAVWATILRLGIASVEKKLDAILTALTVSTGYSKRDQPTTKDAANPAEGEPGK
jgi:hypothetical protein